jgi:hypothetical protein
MIIPSLLFWNQSSNLNQTWHGWSLGSILSKLCPVTTTSKLANWFQKRRFLNIFPIGSYVKTMFADGCHLGWRSGSQDIILKVDHLRTIHPMLSGQFSKLCPVTLTSIQDGHLQQTYCSFNIGPYGKKCLKIFSGWRSGSQDIILKVDHLRTIHPMLALNWLTGFRGEDF